MTTTSLRNLWYFALAARAWAVGLFYRFPKRPPIPAYHTGTSCGLRHSREARSMYVEHNWIPHCFQWTRPYGISRSFKIPMTPEEIAYEEHSRRTYEEMADAMAEDGPPFEPWNPEGEPDDSYYIASDLAYDAWRERR